MQRHLKFLVAVAFCSLFIAGCSSDKRDAASTAGISLSGDATSPASGVMKDYDSGDRTRAVGWGKCNAPQHINLICCQLRVKLAFI